MYRIVRSRMNAVIRMKNNELISSIRSDVINYNSRNEKQSYYIILYFTVFEKKFILEE